MYIGIWKIMTESQKIRWIERNKKKFIKGGKQNGEEKNISKAYGSEN